MNSVEAFERAKQLKELTAGILDLLSELHVHLAAQADEVKAREEKLKQLEAREVGYESSIQTKAQQVGEAEKRLQDLRTEYGLLLAKVEKFATDRAGGAA